MAHSSYLSQYRLDNYAPTVHLSVFTGEIVASGTLTSTPDANAVTLDVSYSVGNSTLVRRGYQIVFRDPSSLQRKGVGRIRFGGVIGVAGLPVRELPRGVASLQSGDAFEVRAYVPFDTKLVAADSSFSPDGQVYSTSGDSGLHPPPVTNSGGPIVGWVDPVTGVLLGNPIGRLSFLVDPASTHTITHHYTLPSIAAFHSGSGSTDQDPVIEISVGQGVVEHIGTDPDNSQTSTNYLPIMAHDTDNPPYEVLLSNYSGDSDNGVNWTVEVLGAAVTVEDIPELALCILWVDDTFITQGAVDLGRSALPMRSQIIGIGYARRVTMTMSGDDGDEHVSFDIQSPLARLSEIASYSKVMVESATPDDWSKVNTLGFARGDTQLWQAYTTGMEAAIDYLIDDSFDDGRYPADYLQRSDPVGQMRELADARNGRITQTERGARFELQAHPAYRALDDRTDIDIELTDDDVYSYEYTVEMADSVEILELQGITAGVSGNDSVYSRAPTSPAGGKNAVTVQKTSPDDQAQANAWAGLRFAAQNNVFIDANGIWNRVGSLKLRCPGQYNVLDFFAGYYQFNYQGKRVDFGSLRFWLRGFAWDIDPQSGEPVTEFTWQAETAAPPGTTSAPADESAIVAPIYTQPPPNWPTASVPDVSTLGKGTANLAVLADDGYLYLLNLNTQTGSRIALSSLHSSPGTPVMLIVDAYNPDNAVIVTDTKAYQLLDVGSPSRSLANEHTFPFTTGNRALQGTRGVNGLFAVNSYRGATNGGSRSDIDVSADSAGSWTNHANEFGTWIGGVGDGARKAIYVYETIAGKILADGYDGAGVVNGRLYDSVNTGGSFSAFDSNTVLSAVADIHCPYQDESITYSGGMVNASGVQNCHLYKTIGGARTDISPIDSSEAYGPALQFNVKTCDVDKRSVLCAGQSELILSPKRGLWLARDGAKGASSWKALIAPTTAVTVTFATFAGDDPQTIWTGGFCTLMRSSDGGATFKDFSALLASLGMASTARVLNIMGLS